MSVAKRVRDLNGQLDGLIEWQRTPLESRSKRLTFQILHDEEVDATFMANVVKGADVRMIQRRDCAGFTLKSLMNSRVIRDTCGQHLDGNCPVQARVAGAINLAHAACAEGADDFVRAEAPTGRE
jgi:hypothetical protein